MKESAEMKDNQLTEDEGIETDENGEESDGLINIDEKNLVRNTLDDIYCVCMSVLYKLLPPF